jgi:hypothetical protein
LLPLDSNPQPYPMRYEPEGGVYFQPGMSLKGKY